jgi:hypothetical protein
MWFSFFTISIKLEDLASGCVDLVWIQMPYDFQLFTGRGIYHPAGRQAGLPARSAAVEEARAGDKIDLFDEAAFLVFHGDDHFRQT